MPNVTTYIRKGDVELWTACPNKAELIHNALRGAVRQKPSPAIRNLAEVNNTLKAAPVPTGNRTWINEDGEVFESEEKDFYTDLIFESRFNKVWNTRTGEEEQEVDAAMVAELKKRGQVR